MNKLLKATGFTQHFLAEFLCNGQKVIDATTGNGHDTLFLAEAVGPLGVVYAFDIQEQALQTTKELLTEHHCLQQVKLIHAGHEKIKEYVRESVQAIIYNLGYLPGGNKEIITKGETTLLSLQQGTELLSSGGVIALIIYPGHPGGRKEAELIEAYTGALSPRRWQVLKWSRLNGDYVNAPYVLLMLKS
jgi:methylase of polypeptide subunit release factors